MKLKKRMIFLLLTLLLTLSMTSTYAATLEYFNKAGRINNATYVCQALGSYELVTAKTSYELIPAARSAAITGYYLDSNLELKSVNNGNGSASATCVEAGVRLPSGGLCFTKLSSTHTVVDNTFKSGIIEMTTE